MRLTSLICHYFYVDAFIGYFLHSYSTKKTLGITDLGVEIYIECTHKRRQVLWTGFSSTVRILTVPEKLQE
jgi:hypothetical protein